MDHTSKREQMRGWIELGLREGLTYVELARRAGTCERTVRRWSERFRRERVLSAKPDRDEHVFVHLIENLDPAAARIEIIVPGQKPVVINGALLIEFLGRLLSEKR